MPNRPTDKGREKRRERADHRRAHAGNMTQRLHCAGIEIAKENPHGKEAQQQIGHQAPERRLTGKVPIGQEEEQGESPQRYQRPAAQGAHPETHDQLRIDIGGAPQGQRQRGKVKGKLGA